MAGDSKLRELTSIVDLRPGMKNVTCVFIVIDKGTTNQTKDGSIVRKCRVADGSASIVFSLWNEQADAIEEGDILKLTKGYASLWKGSMVLYSGKYGILQKVGEFTMVYSDSPDMSDTSHEFAQPQTSRGPPPAPHRRGDEARMTLNRNGNNHLRPGQNDPELMYLSQWSSQDSHRDHHPPHAFSLLPIAPADWHRTDSHREIFHPHHLTNPHRDSR